MRIRIVRNLLSGEYADHKLNGCACVGELLLRFRCALDSQVFVDGILIADTKTIVGDGSLVLVRQVPKGATFAIIVSVASIIAGGVALYKACQASKALSSISDIQTSPSLRGSTNSARKSGQLPILLGHYRIYPDVAALPYTRYEDNNQYLIQLFSFGYNNVSLDLDTAKIGDTLISKYSGVQLSANPSTLYPARVIESQVSTELENDGAATLIERTTASNTTKINVGLAAPNGLYQYSDNQRTSVSIGVRIEWNVSGEDDWNVAFEETIRQNIDCWRKMYTITPSGSDDGTYDVRVMRTTEKSDSAYVQDTLYLDVIQSFTKNASTGSADPIKNPSDYRLLAIDIKASNRLNGSIDSMNVEGTLKARAWDGDGSGHDHWLVAETRNPASAILYLLTDSLANPRPVRDSQIVWSEFEVFYRYCEDMGFHCDAWVTGDYTIGELVDLICQSNMCTLRRSADSIGIIIDQANPYIAQMFTPRNSADFSMKRDFTTDETILVLGYVDADSGYEEVERNVSVVDGGITFDRDLDDDDGTTGITLFGVTDATHAAKVGRTKLLEIIRRRRTYSWSSDIEGILCVPGDVVLFGNDHFLFGTGEGRIRSIVRDSSGKITHIRLDTEIDMTSGNTYGIRIRTQTGSILDPIAVVTKAGSERILELAASFDAEVNAGDLVAVGIYPKETLKVLVTDITQDANHVCKITGTDYAGEIYDDDTEIPDYDPGICRLPDGNTPTTSKTLLKGETPSGIPGVSIIWKGALVEAPAAPQINWVYRNTTDGVTYVYNGSAWTAMVADGDPGKDAVTIQIYAPNGNAFRTGTAKGTLYAHVFRGTEDITDTIEESKFQWTRVSSSATTSGEGSDAAWGTSAKATGHRILAITPDDVVGRTTFSVTVDIE